MKRILLATILAAAALGYAQSVRATELITNGGFETGNFTGWVATNASGSWFDWNAVAAGFDSGGFFPPTAPPVGLREAYQGTASSANSPYTLDQTITIPAASTASITWRHRLRVDLFNYCTTVAACGTVVYQVQILNTSNVVLQTLYSFTAPGRQISDTGWQYNLRNLNAYAGQTIKIRFRTVASITFAGPGQMEIDAVSVQTPGVTTAATATLSGQLTNSYGQPISGAAVKLSDGTTTWTTLSSSFGYYQFTDVATGMTYVLDANSKQYSFATSPLAVNVNGDVANLDFQASP